MKPLVVQLRAKRHEESVPDGDRVKGCSGHRPGGCSVMQNAIRPPPPPEVRERNREKTERETL